MRVSAVASGEGGHATAGSAEASEDALAFRPGSFTMVVDEGDFLIRAVQMCGEIPSSYRLDCHRGVVEHLANFAQVKEGMTFCSLLEYGEDQQCLQHLTESVWSYWHSSKKGSEVCNALPAEYENECRKPWDDAAFTESLLSAVQGGEDSSLFLSLWQQVRQFVLSMQCF
jgi:hypothetical protein